MAKVALEALKGIKTMSELASDYRVHSVQIGKWKKELLERLPEVFERGKPRTEVDFEKKEEQLHSKIGQLTMEVDWLRKKYKQLYPEAGGGQS